MINVGTLGDLAGTWRDEATLLRRRGAGPQADTLESAAQELEEAIHGWWAEALTLDQAAQETGYSRSTLERHIQRGVIPNVGKPRRPLVRRCDLSFRGSPQGPRPEPDVAGEILSRGA